VPAGATVIGGFFQGADIDTGTETLDIDIGWASNGTDAATRMASATSARWTAMRSACSAGGGYLLPVHQHHPGRGFKTFAAETKIIGTVNTAAAAGGTGLLKVVVYYVMA
jgi:hypothetical protein